MSTIWQTTNKSRKNLLADINLLLDAASAVDWLGPKTAPVILKPNLVVSKPASGGATTHPEIAAGIISFLRDHGYSSISIAEGSYVGDSTTRAYKHCGYTALAEKFGIKLIDLQKDSPVTVNIGGDEYKVCRTIADLKDRGGSLINLPVLKGHGQTHLTCALKNMKGCIPDSEKRRYHSLGVFRPVAMINTVITPAFKIGNKEFSCQSITEAAACGLIPLPAEARLFPGNGCPGSAAGRHAPYNLRLSRRR